MTTDELKSWALTEAERVAGEHESNCELVTEVITVGSGCSCGYDNRVEDIAAAIESAYMLGRQDIQDIHE